MKTFEQINYRFDKGTLRSAKEGFSRQWIMISNKKSLMLQLDLMI